MDHKPHSQEPYIEYPGLTRGQEIVTAVGLLGVAAGLGTFMVATMIERPEVAGYGCFGGMLSGMVALITYFGGFEQGPDNN